MNRCGWYWCTMPYCGTLDSVRTGRLQSFATQCPRPRAPTNQGRSPTRSPTRSRTQSHRAEFWSLTRSALDTLNSTTNWPSTSVTVRHPHHRHHQEVLTLVWSRYLAQEWHVRTGKEDRFQFSTCYLNVRRGGVPLMIDRHRATSCTNEEVLCRFRARRTLGIVAYFCCTTLRSSVWIRKKIERMYVYNEWYESCSHSIPCASRCSP